MNKIIFKNKRKPIQQIPPIQVANINIIGEGWIGCGDNDFMSFRTLLGTYINSSDTGVVKWVGTYDINNNLYTQHNSKNRLSVKGEINHNASIFTYDLDEDIINICVSSDGVPMSSHTGQDIFGGKGKFILELNDGTSTEFYISGVLRYE